MTNVTVTGNVTVGIGASLDLEGNSIIVGNLLANNCNQVGFNLAGAPTAPLTVDGNVGIGNCTGDPAFQNVTPIHIGGDFQCNNNIACILEGANVGGNVQFNNNVNPHGKGSFILGNTIGKDLQCQNNSPAPQGSNNTVVGNPDQNSEGQCKGF
jgi:hypothetical protein